MKLFLSVLKKSINPPALLLNVRRTMRFSYFFTHVILDPISENSMYASSSTTNIGILSIFCRSVSLIILFNKETEASHYNETRKVTRNAIQMINNMIKEKLVEEEHARQKRNNLKSL